MAGVSIRPVKSRRDLKRFVKFPFGLHREHPLWVPPLKLRAPAVPQPRHEPLLRARRGGVLPRRARRPRGRQDQRPCRPALQRLPGEERGDVRLPRVRARTPRSLEALLDAAADWLLERGKERMVGPMDFAMNDESGILIEGFDLRPMILAALAPALLPGADRGERHGQGDGPSDVGAHRRLRTATSSTPRSRAGREGGERARDRDPADAPPTAARGHATPSPRSTTRPGLRTGTSSLLEERTSTFLRPGAELVFDENWFMIAEQRTARSWAWRSRFPTSTRCWPG